MLHDFPHTPPRGLNIVQIMSRKSESVLKDAIAAIDLNIKKNHVFARQRFFAKIFTVALPKSTKICAVLIFAVNAHGVSAYNTKVIVGQIIQSTMKAQVKGVSFKIFKRPSLSKP